MIEGLGNRKVDTYGQTGTVKKQNDKSAPETTKDSVDIKGNQKPEEKNFLQRFSDNVKSFYKEHIVGTYENMTPAGKCALHGAAIGGVVGGAGGYLAGALQESKEVVITRTYPVPVTENRNLGEIPKDWYQNDWSGWDRGPIQHDHDYAPRGWENVYREAPVLDNNGKPVMTSKTETITSKTYGKLGGTLMGCALGTVTGLLGGIAFRMISTFGDTGEKK